MFEEIIIDQNIHWADNQQKFKSTNNIQREKFNKLIDYLKIPQVIAITGIRRCGKSTMLKETIYYLINECNINRENILFLNLEHPFLLQFSRDINYLEKLFQEYLSLKLPREQIYVLLDEVQFFENWPVFIKSHYENSKVKFIITGSNSSLLSSEMVTLLSGRALALELYPLSYKELVKANNIPCATKSDIISSNNKLKNLLLKILKIGGFPEIFFLPDATLYADILASYAKTIVLQDVAPRLNIRKSRQLEQLFTYLATNISAFFSYNKLSTYFALSDKSVKEYIQAFSEAYLIFELEKFSYSLKSNLKIVKKFYIIDCGLANACGFKFSNNDGKLLENMIFVDCKQRNLEVFYYKTTNNLEVDLVLKKNNEITAVQVYWEAKNEATFAREVNALSQTLDELSLNEGRLISMETVPQYQIKDSRIKHVPAYQWLLR